MYTCVYVYILYLSIYLTVLNQLKVHECQEGFTAEVANHDCDSSAISTPESSGRGGRNVCAGGLEWVWGKGRIFILSVFLQLIQKANQTCAIDCSMQILDFGRKSTREEQKINKQMLTPVIMTEGKIVIYLIWKMNYLPALNQH